MLELRTRLRRLLRRPGYVVAVVLSLGLGMSVTLAAWSFANALVFRALPGISDRRGLVRVERDHNGLPFTSTDFETIEAQRSHTFTTLAAQGDSALPVMLPAGPESLPVAFASTHFFETLGTRPILGRLLTAADAEASAPPVAVIGGRLWRRAFNGDPGVVGRALTVGNRAFAIVGVTLADFSGLRIIDVGARESDYPQVWICLRDARLWPATAPPGIPWLHVAGRLPNSASLPAARAELDVVAQRMTRASSPRPSVPPQHAPFRVYRAGLNWHDEPSQSLLTIGLFLFIPLSVLAIGCVNVVNLQLARAMEEAGELSLRLALGASRPRIVRLLLLEVICLAVVSGCLGCLGAGFLLSRAGALSPVPLGIDPSVLAFTLVLVTGVVCVAGLLPAWQSSRDIVAAGLREFDGLSRRGVRLRGLLVVVQVAASVTLLALSGLAVRSLINRAPAVVQGAEQTLTADFDFTQVRPSVPRPGLFMASVLDHLASAPSVRAAAFSTFVTGGAPLRYWRASDAPQVERVAYGGFVTPQWFAATDATFLAGDQTRRFSEGSAVVNAALASILGADRTDGVIGLPLRVRAGHSAEIVAVVADTQRSADGTPLPMLLLPMPSGVPATVSLIVRATDLNAARGAVRAAVTDTDPGVPIARLETLDDRLSDASGGLRNLATFGVAIGALSIALAGAGLHSLLSYTVRRRTREIGIRVALGARTGEIIWTVTRPGLWLVAMGAVAGVAVAAPIAMVLRSAMVGVLPLDPRGLLPSFAILLCVAIVAAIGPTCHAACVDPIQSLREE
jgi:putative ABC transport system permease protein